ncbi:uncharacterized protein LOC132282823 [Cornus florida]|uniref:uncharacterized protein LOC132282823 n=1 Tax=Cornus florida TaxID=4283 RepID=UPI002898C189|nr:uncharacterized protein LOC132282823 [Cornus florida]
MLSHRSLIFSLLATFLLLSATFVSFCHGGTHFPTFQTVPSAGKVDEGKFDGVVSWGPKRFLAEEPVGNSSIALAAKRTYRKDPLDGFKRYTGGWNISNHHYWASVGYTAAPLFVIAVLWFLGFGLCLSLVCLCYCCCSREPYGYSRTAYALSLIFLMLFTVAAIIGCVVLYTGQGKFHSSTTKTLEYVVHQANTTVEKLRSVSESLDVARKIGVDRISLPSNVQTDIDQIQNKINSSVSTLGDRTADNSRDIQDLLNSVRLALIIIAAVMLLLILLGFVFSIFGMQFLVYILVTIGWIFVAGTFILCGIFLLLHNVTADTCVAMDEWVQKPTAHSALDDILPCVDNATAQETLLRSKEVTSQVVNLINQVITNVSNINFSPNFAPLYYNQSGPLLPLLCDPFNPDLTDRPCTAGEVDLSNATQVWKNYVCEVSANGICTTTGRLTPSIYDQMAVGVNVSYTLYHYGPFLVDLQDCTFVRQTFGDITRDHCPGLRRYSEWIYVGLVMVSVAVMLSLVFWVIYGRERRHRVYTKTHMARSAPGYEEGKGT